MLWLAFSCIFAMLLAWIQAARSLISSKIWRLSSFVTNSMSWFALSPIRSSLIAQRKRFLRSWPEYESSRRNAQPNSPRTSFGSLIRKVSFASIENWFRESGLTITRTKAAGHHQTESLNSCMTVSSSYPIL